MPNHVRAPWTPKQVEALNAYQAGETDGHPYTCPMHSCGHVLLVATPDGWRCREPICDYRQDWAHAWTADRRPERWNDA